MKKVLLIALLVLVVSTMSIFAANDRLGIGAGLALQAPFRVATVAEYDFGPATIDLSLGYSNLLGQSYFHLGINGNYVLPGLFKNAELSDFGLKASVGGRVDLDFSKFVTMVGIGIPVTLAYYFDSVPIKIFARGVPELVIAGGVMLLSYTEIGAMWLF
ncbi:MAG: hypothetical protein WC224_04385 [Sphaerochaetaceae bacterium]